MNIVKAKLLLATLLSFTVGTVGCATAQQISTAPLDSTQMLSNANQIAMNSTNVGEITRPNMVSESARPATENQTVTSSAEQITQASFSQTVQPTSNSLAAAPLTTLGQGDDLLNMVQHAPGVVLLDFYADWCGPCRTQGGILHEMESTASQNGASMIKVNIDQHRQLANAFNVTSLPTLILVKDGQIIERQTGIASHQRVASLLAR